MSKQRRYLSIKTKLFAVILLVLVVAIAANSYINIFSFKSAYTEALEEKSYAVAQALRRTVYNNLRYFSLDGFGQMDEYLQSIVETNEGISYCFIADKEGRILYHTNPELSNVFLDRGSYADLYPLKPFQKITLPIDQYYESLIPIVWEKEAIGTINIGIKQEIINSRIKGMQFQSFVVLLLALMFCLFLFYQSLYKIIIAPISKMLGVIRNIISHKEFGRHVEVRHNDEIGDLASLFNRMTDELKKYKEHLEDLVDERTADLQKEINERKRVELELREAMQVKSDLIAMVSHELRTPLAAIKTSIDMIVAGVSGKINPDQEDLLATAKKNVNRLARLINDVLDFQKLEAGKMRLRLEEADLNELIRNVHKVMKPLAEGKGLQFNLNLDKNLPKLKFDQDRIIQVLNNLIGNSIKFTKEGGIFITTIKKKDELEVEVSDTGIGIEEKNIPKLFHSFEQISLARSGRVEGTGLGLAICKDIIEAHRGKIIAKSKGEGKGTSFIFTLPLNQIN